jgi:hypothetical protein
MTHRKNLGLGLGKGYKNLIPHDSFVHMMSAKGVKQKIPIDSVTINWKEGRQNYEKYPMTFKSVAEANKKILQNSFDAPASGGYDKHSFTIKWKDGNVYEGRMDVKHPSQMNADLDMKHHVEEFANYLIHKSKTEFPRYSKEDRKYARDLLNKYSLDAKSYAENESEAIHRVNPMLFRKVKTSKNVNEFIDKVLKSDKTTRDKVSIPVLSDFYKRVKSLDAKTKEIMFHIIDKDGEFETDYNRKDLLNYANEINNASYESKPKRKAKTIEEAREILENNNIIVELNAKGTNYKKQLKVGTQVEMEHTKDRNVAKKIAQTHLKENKDYYAFFDSKDKKSKEYLVTMHQLHSKKKKDLSGRELYNKGDPYFYEPVECRTNEDEYYDNDMYAKGKKPQNFWQKIGLQDPPHRGRPEKVPTGKIVFLWGENPQELIGKQIAHHQKSYPYTKREKKIGFDTLAGGSLGYSLGLLGGGLMGGWVGFPLGAITGNIVGRVTTKERGRKPAYRPSLFRRLLNPREDLIEERQRINLIERARLKSEAM